MNVDEVKKLTVEKLKTELKSRDLDTSGKKAELVERLETHLQAQPAEASVHANGTSTSETAHTVSSDAAPAKARKPIVWSAPAPEAASTAPDTSEAAGAPAELPAEQAAETAETEKQKARGLKFGISTETVDTTFKEAGKRKAEDVETAALVSDDMIAKRRERFKSEEDTESEQKKRERQARFNPDASKQAERKERFEKWLPSGGSSAPGMKKSANADVAAALGTSLDNSVPKRGGGGPKGKAASTAPKIEYSEEFKAKAEARKARFASKAEA